METVNQAEMQNQETTTQEDGQEQSQEAKKDTFTQEDVNRMIQKRVAKYADYEALKEKAAKLTPEFLDAEPGERALLVHRLAWRTISGRDALERG